MAASVDIKTKNGTVTLSASVARRSLFLSGLMEADTSGSATIDAPLDIEGTNVCVETVGLVKEYMDHFYGPEATEKPSVIPKPLPGALDKYISAWELSFINKKLLVDGDVWQHDALVSVVNIAQRLEIADLRDLLAAWCAVQVDALCQGKNMMDAAEHIRNFFSIPNEWSEEDMGHLQREMEYYESL